MIRLYCLGLTSFAFSVSVLTSYAGVASVLALLVSMRLRVCMSPGELVWGKRRGREAGESAHGSSLSPSLRKTKAPFLSASPQALVGIAGDKESTAEARACSGVVSEDPIHDPHDPQVFAIEGCLEETLALHSEYVPFVSLKSLITSVFSPSAPASSLARSALARDSGLNPALELRESA